MNWKKIIVDFLDWLDKILLRIACMILTSLTIYQIARSELHVEAKSPQAIIAKAELDHTKPAVESENKNSQQN